MNAVIPTHVNKIRLSKEVDFCLDARDTNLVEVGVNALKAEQETLVKVARKNCPYAIRAIEAFTDFLNLPPLQNNCLKRNSLGSPLPLIHQGELVEAFVR